jgi:hypothetical protein
MEKRLKTDFSDHEIYTVRDNQLPISLVIIRAQ